MKGFLSVVIVISTLNLGAQELFPGADKLTSCEAPIPLTYKGKDKVACEKAALKYKDQELVLIKTGKKGGGITYASCYVVTKEAKGDTFVYLESPEEHDGEHKRAVFVEFKSKYDRFYVAECFNKVLEDNPELKKLLTAVKIDD